MTHVSEEEMVEGYYAGVSDECRSHLAVCLECSSMYRGICETLESANGARVPERGAGYGREVWARVSAELPARRGSWKRWVWIPALAAGAAMVFAGSTCVKKSMRSVPPVVEVARAQVPVTVKHVEPKPRLVERVVTPPKGVSRKAVLSDAEQDLMLLALNSALETDTKSALPQVLDIIQGDSSEKTKEHALFVLAQSDSAEARRAVLDFASQSSNAALQAKAVRMMGVMGGEGAGQELVGLYQTSSNQALKREILNGLMFSGSKTMLWKVASTESDPGLRDSAMANLSIADRKSQVTTLPLTVRITGAPKMDKRTILNSIFLASDSQVLLNILKQEPDAELRVATIRSLAVMGEKSQVLANIYRVDGDERVRRAVLDALVVQQNSEALADLARLEVDLQRRAEILSRLATIRTQEKITR